MRQVTGGAIFCDRFMLPKEWAALFRMTGEALLIECQSLHRPGASRAMWAVAIGAGEQSLADRMNRGLVKICAHFAMTACAQVELSFLAQDAIGLMDQMTIAADEVGRFVCATLPVHPTGVLMAPETLAVLVVPRYCGVFAEHDQASEIFAVRHGMRLTATVTGFAALDRKRGAQIVHLRMLGGEYLLELLFMAFGTDIGTDIIAARRHLI